MNTEKIRIDWRAQFDALQPFIDGLGGIVAVDYKGNSCAPNAFVATLISAHARCSGQTQSSGKPRPGRSIIIDRSNYAVRYLSELRREFESCFGITLPSAAIGGQRLAPTIASNNTASGNQDIEVHLHFNADSEPVLCAGRDSWIDSLCAQLKSVLETHRVMIVLMHGVEHEQREFWDKLWHNGLRKLVDDGLLLVRMIDTSPEAGSNSNSNSLKIAPLKRTIYLPTSLDQAQQRAARDDLAVWVKETLSISHETADAFALSFVQSHVNDINRLHDNVGLWIEGLRSNTLEKIEHDRV